MGGKVRNRSTFCMSRPRLLDQFKRNGCAKKAHKCEHLNKWSTWNKYIRADITNVQIPQEMSLFTELKTWTENVHERSVRVLWMAADWRRTLQWTSAKGSQEQRSRVMRRTNKASASWRRRSCGRRSAGLDSPGAPESSLSNSRRG